MVPAGVHPSWGSALERVRADIEFLDETLARREAAGAIILPDQAVRYAALAMPLEAVRVLILGQDPYPTPGHACGLAFSVPATVRPLPPSLRNIFVEYQADLGYPPPAHGDIRRWVDQGVCLFNTVLTYELSSPTSLPGPSGDADGWRCEERAIRRAWERVTSEVVRTLAGEAAGDRSRKGALVAVLWGAKAQAKRRLLGDTPCVLSAHPSPLSAHKGFLGSRPFTQVNRLLEAQGVPGIDWRLEDA